jgi:hypothetical protein
MRDLDSVGEKLLSCDQQTIVTYMFLRERPMPLMELSKAVPYCEVGETVAKLLEKGLVAYRGEEVFPT